MINFLKNLLIVFAFIEAGMLIGLSAYIAEMRKANDDLRCDRLTLWNQLVDLLKQQH